MTVINEYSLPTIRKLSADYVSFSIPLAARNIDDARSEVQPLGDYLWANFRERGVYVDDMVLTTSSTIKTIFNSEPERSYYLFFYIKDRYMFLKNKEAAVNYVKNAISVVKKVFEDNNVKHYMMKVN